MRDSMKIRKVFIEYKKYFKEAFDDLKTKGRRHKQIPNILTSTRLIAAPFFIIPAALNKNLLWLIIFIIVFSLTDALDGFIARKYNLVSELGKDLDAICDKVFALSLLIAVSIFKPLLLCNIILEVIIAIINIREKIHNKKPRTLMVGKIKAWALYSLIGIAFINEIVIIEDVLNVAIAATICMQMLTITSYVLKYEGHSDEVPMLDLDKNLKK